MDLEMSFEERIEILKKMYALEKDENVRKIILHEIREIEELINVRGELERKGN